MSGPTEGRAVGVVGDHPAVVEAIEAVGGRPAVGDARTVAETDPSLVVAIGEAALLDVVRAGITAPTLPVEAGRAVRSVPGMAVEPAVDRLVNGAFEPVDYPVLDVQSAIGSARALQDVMLVTAEPARISEYTVRSHGELVDRFRADGVLVATPAGSQGYARACDAPVTHPAARVLTVVPVSPFATDQDSWVVPMDGLELAVERDETPVELLADDRATGTVAHGETVRIDRDGSLPVAVVPESYDVFG
ncbi:ATP-NAD kinase [Halorarius litoreus]|uniref:ATP-NAD kinase n=1 Tax=Halorarius litoreus TaxID=2962676 RepID=UPI0020CB796C|nr:ATP-NAD kinase [Halorarius litoreus]